MADKYQEFEEKLARACVFIEAVTRSVSQDYPMTILGENLESILNEVRESHDILKQGIAEVEQEKQSLAEEMSKLREDRETLTQGINQLANEKQALTEERSKLEGDRETLTQGIDQLENEKKALAEKSTRDCEALETQRNQQMADIGNRLTQLQEESTKMQKWREVNTSNAELVNGQARRMENDRQARQDDLVNARSEREAAKRDLDAARGDLNSARVERQRAAQDRACAKRDREAADQDRVDTEADVEDARKDREAAKEAWEKVHQREKTLRDQRIDATLDETTRQLEQFSFSLNNDTIEHYRIMARESQGLVDEADGLTTEHARLYEEKEKLLIERDNYHVSVASMARGCYTIIMQPVPRKRTYASSEDLAGGEWREHVETFADFMLGHKPAIGHDSQVTLEETVAEMAPAAFDIPARQHLLRFFDEADPEKWFCFKQLIKVGHKHPTATICILYHETPTSFHPTSSDTRPTHFTDTAPFTYRILTTRRYMQTWDHITSPDHRAAAVDIDIPLQAAWREKQGEIDDFLTQDMRNGMAAAYICSPMRQAKVVYVVSFKAESKILTRHLNSVQSGLRWKSSLAEEPQAGSPVLMHYAKFLRTFDPDTATNMVIVMDNEVNPSTSGEVAFGRANQWASKRREQPDAGVGNASVVMAPFSCSRTITALNQWTKSRTREITITDMNPKIAIHACSEKAWRERMKKFILAALFTRRVLICTYADNDINLVGEEDFAKTTMNFERITEAAKESMVFTVSPVMTFSTKCDGLRVVMIEPTVAQARLCSMRDHCRNGNWQSNIHLCVSFRPAIQPGNTSAYGRDLHWTVLMMVKTWPGVSFLDMPVRPIADIHAVRQIGRRLMMTSCIEEIPGSQGTFRSTNLGNTMLELRKNTSTMDFHVAHFLGGVAETDSTMPSHMKRVMIRMAVIAAYRPHMFMWRAKNSSPPTIDQLAEYCVGVSAQRANRGTLWIALGIWQKMVNEAFFQLPPVIDELKDTQLGDLLIDQVETRLMWAWLHRMAFYQHGKQPRDLVSTQDLVEYNLEFSDVFTSLPETVINRGVCAIYMDLELAIDEEKEGHEYIVTGPTVISSATLAKVKEKLGMNTQTAITPTHPWRCCGVAVHSKPQQPEAA
ncbi:hypothetical protein HD806DRAFT_548000 [Xylariaceae sp. AK1471]|nr:hypothetical protein HD806DRAFT_548000 [Xylariaceae sp. AK1471]